MYNDYELLYLISWHSDEAMAIILDKYENLIEIELRKFKIAEYHYDDFKQECLLTLMDAIKTYDERHNKTFFKYVELLIDRRIMRLLSYDVRYSRTFVLQEEIENNYSFEDKNSNFYYADYLASIKKVDLDEFKRNILQEIYFKGVSIEEFCAKYNLCRKDVYNHIYLLRTKLKRSLLDKD